MSTVRGYVMIIDGAAFTRPGFTKDCQLFEWRRDEGKIYTLIEAEGEAEVLGYMLHHSGEERGLLYRGLEEAERVLETFKQDELLVPRNYQLMPLMLGEPA